jgi:hypothetical protein
VELLKELKLDNQIAEGRPKKTVASDDSKNLTRLGITRDQSSQQQLAGVPKRSPVADQASRAPLSGLSLRALKFWHRGSNARTSESR